MTRPPLEVADLVRSAGTAFIERNRHWLSWTHLRACSPSHAAARRHWVVTSINVPVVGIAPPSPITVAAIGMARSVRPELVNAGSRHAAAKESLQNSGKFPFHKNLHRDSLNNFDEISRGFCWRKLAETRAARPGEVEHMPVAGPAVGIVGYSYYR
jgi:hypothetical protein